jgi:hypothetical protein
MRESNERELYNNDILKIIEINQGFNFVNLHEHFFYIPRYDLTSILLD